MSKRRTAGRWLVLTVALVLVLTACTPGPAEPSPSPSASTNPPEAAITVADIQAHLDDVLRWGWGPLNPIDCEGSGPIAAGMTLVCERTAAPPDASVSERRVLVAVLGDDGRYTFSYAGPALNGALEEYPEGLASCSDLAAPPQLLGGPEREHGLAYPALLHHWLALGSPAEMDPDGNGRPCEAEYPAAVIDRTLSSPLSPSNPERPEATLEEVRQHAEAILNGAFHTLELTGCDAAGPAVEGASLVCRTASDHPTQEFDIQLLVLDGTGRYSLRPLGDTAQVADYPPGSECEAFVAPPDPDRPSLRGPGYAEVLAAWYAQGQPQSWDGDGDSRPCEDVFSTPEVIEVVGSQLRP